METEFKKPDIKIGSVNIMLFVCFNHLVLHTIVSIIQSLWWNSTICRLASLRAMPYSYVLDPTQLFELLTLLSIGRCWDGALVVVGIFAPYGHAIGTGFEYPSLLTV